jgi:hypothetical protein
MSAIEPGMEQYEIDDARSRGCVVTVHGTGNRWRLVCRCIPPCKDKRVEVYRVFFCDVTDDPCDENFMKEISS